MRFPQLKSLRLALSTAVLGLVISSACAVVAHYRAGDGDVDELMMLPAERAFRLTPIEYFLAGILVTTGLSLIAALVDARRIRRLPRMSVRNLMVVIALAAVVAAFPASLRQRSRNLERIAAFHERQRYSLFATDLEAYLVLTAAQGAPPPTPQEFEDHKSAMTFIDYHDDLEERYLEAAGYPWRLVERDPLPPPRPSESIMKRLRAPYAEYLGRQAGLAAK